MPPCGGRSRRYSEGRGTAAGESVRGRAAVPRRVTLLARGGPPCGGRSQRYSEGRGACGGKLQACELGGEKTDDASRAQRLALLSRMLYGPKGTAVRVLHEQTAIRPERSQLCELSDQAAVRPLEVTVVRPLEVTAVRVLPAPAAGAENGPLPAAQSPCRSSG